MGNVQDYLSLLYIIGPYIAIFCTAFLIVTGTLVYLIEKEIEYQRLKRSLHK